MKRRSEIQAKYDKVNTKGLYLKLHLVNDKDILDHLDKQPSKQGYIKEVIRKDMKKK